MKTFLLVQLFLMAVVVQGQDTIPNLYVPIVTHSQIFSLSPISKKVDKVNGLVFGIGHVENKRVLSQAINGINVEANPAPIAGAFMAFLAVLYLPEILKPHKIPDSLRNTELLLKIKNLSYTPHLKINGLNLSTGCFFTTTSMNGLNISVGNKFNNFNGVSITALGTIADKHNGIAIGICNANNKLTGGSFAVYNQSFESKGLQLGVFNNVGNNHGLQIGIFNKSHSKGFQLGLWNSNPKRSMPFINW